MKRINNLYLDASTRYMIIILEVDGKIIKKTKKDNYQKHSENFILTVFNDFLNPFDLKPDDISNLYITTGPGSFVGVRIAMIFAKTLKMIYPKINVFAISSLLTQVESSDLTTSIISISNSVNYLQNFVNFKSDGEIFKYDILKLNQILKTTKNIIVKNFNQENFCEIFVNNCKLYAQQIKNLNNLSPIYLPESW